MTTVVTKRGTVAVLVDGKYSKKTVEVSPGVFNTYQLAQIQPTVPQRLEWLRVGNFDKVESKRLLEEETQQ